MIGEAQIAQATLSSAAEVIAIANEHGYPLWLAGGKIMRDWSLGALGQPEEGTPLLLEGTAGVQISGQKWGLPIMLILLAETYKRTQQDEDSLKINSPKLPKSSTQHRSTGSRLNYIGSAEYYYNRCISITLPRTAIATPSVLPDGKNAKFWELLAPVYGWFTEGFDTRDLKEAKALLDELTS
jgi:hypothetical protein